MKTNKSSKILRRPKRFLKLCTACEIFPREEGSNHCMSCKALLKHIFKDK